jgi:hypothetical protein
MCVQVTGVPNQALKGSMPTTSKGRGTGSGRFTYIVRVPRCAQTLLGSCLSDLQGQGQYWADLSRTSNEAIAYYTSGNTFRKDGKDMLVFDIDETCLSNLGAIRNRGYITLQNSTASHPAHPDMQGNVASSDDSSESFAPALEAIRDVYLAAYDYGLSVRALFPKPLIKCTPTPILAGKVCLG